MDIVSNKVISAKLHLQKKKCNQRIVANKLLILMQKVTLWKKIHVIYNFFLIRKICSHILTFVFYCLIIPATVLVPEVEIPKWGCIYIPTIITLLTVVATPRCLYPLKSYVVLV
jgi:beta-mannan synthase